MASDWIAAISAWNEWNGTGWNGSVYGTPGSGPGWNGCAPGTVDPARVPKKDLLARHGTGLNGNSLFMGQHLKDLFVIVFCCFDIKLLEIDPPGAIC